MLEYLLKKESIKFLRYLIFVKTGWINACRVPIQSVPFKEHIIQSLVQNQNDLFASDNNIEKRSALLYLATLERYLLKMMSNTNLHFYWVKHGMITSSE